MDFNAVIAKTDEPVVVVDLQGDIIRINAAFTDVYGWTQADLAGKSLVEIIPGELHDAHHMGMARVRKTGKSKLLNQYLDLEMMYKDGTRAVAPHYITFGEIDGVPTLAAIIQPPEER